VELLEQVVAVALRDQPNHPDTLISMGNLAAIYGRLHQNDRAMDMWRRVVEGRVRVLGPAHPFTQQSIRYYLGSARRDRAYWEEARRTLEPILDRSRRELGPEAEPTIALTGWLANALGRLGQTEKAVALVDGLPENREALWIRTRLALELREHGRFAEARPLLEQTVAEAARLRQKLPKRDQTIEEARGIAQVLLGRGPGLAPGVSPSARPPAPFTIEAPFRGVTPIADGRIAPGEYGPGIEATFEGDSNPGRLYAWLKSHSKAPEDLSVRIHAAYTDRSLFLAFRVRDQFVDASDMTPNSNDSVEVFIDGDQVANDLTPVSSPGRVGNREGFDLISDARGHQLTFGTDDFTNADWKVATARTPDGYIIEFEIPLALIDTRDGPEYVPATSGSELRVNFGITDNDGSVSDQTDYGIFWAEDPALSPWTGGEDFWTVSLRLVPKPSSSPRPAAGR
jgi:hypothetical protein